MFDPIYPGVVVDPRDLRNAVRDPEPKDSGCECPACRDARQQFGRGHASDCAVHAAPAYAIDSCNCDLANMAPPESITATFDWTAAGKTVLIRPKLRPDLLRRHIEATTLPSRRLPRVVPFLLGVLFGLLAGAAGLLLVATGG